jgi:glutathione S-transferase
MSYYTHPRCKICNSGLRDEIDLFLIGDKLNGDGSRLTYEQIVDWALFRGLDTSTGALSRHRTNHLQPALSAALETQQVIDAISSATGKKLSVQTAVVNIVTTHILRRLNSLKDDKFDGVDLEKLLNLVPRLAEVAGKLERTETALQDVAKATTEKLTSKGISEETIREIEEQILGMRR